MSSNRLIYDKCAYKENLDRSTGSLEYILDPVKYENKKKCRHEFGLVSGQDVSLVKGNLIDLESELRGQTRKLSKCNADEFFPDSGKKIHINNPSGSDPRVIDTTLVHLKSCQMINYKKVPTPN